MTTRVIKDGRYAPMQSPLSRHQYVLTLGCGHLWSYSGEPEKIPNEVDCTRYHDDRGLSAPDPKLNWIHAEIASVFGADATLVKMENEVLHEKVLEARLNGGNPLG